MSRSRSHSLWLGALAGSLAAHAGLLAVVDAAIERKAREAQQRRAEAEPALIPVELELGVDEPLPPSPVWLGYVEAKEQAAPLSESEQAAFTDQAQPPISAQEAIERLSQARQKARELARHALRAVAEALAISAAPGPGPQHKDSEPSEPEPSQAAAIAVAAAMPLSEPGALSDKQSPPTSIIEIPPEQWKLGRPLAGHGLELKPHRPTFTLLTLMTAAPGNPLCEIKFDAHGVPQSASILESSGDRRVDDAILASLYRWRAAGSDLEDVPPSQTLPVQMRILLTRKRTA